MWARKPGNRPGGSGTELDLEGGLGICQTAGEGTPAWGTTEYLQMGANIDVT